MEHNVSERVYSQPAGQDIPSILWTLNVYYYKSEPIQLVKLMASDSNVSPAG
jgi:hypothetical protein